MVARLVHNDVCVQCTYIYISKISQSFHLAVRVVFCAAGVFFGMRLSRTPQRGSLIFAAVASSITPAADVGKSGQVRSGQVRSGQVRQVRSGREPGKTVPDISNLVMLVQEWLGMTMTTSGKVTLEPRGQVRSGQVKPVACCFSHQLLYGCP